MKSEILIATFTTLLLLIGLCYVATVGGALITGLWRAVRPAPRRWHYCPKCGLYHSDDGLAQRDAPPAHADRQFCDTCFSQLPRDHRDRRVIRLCMHCQTRLYGDPAPLPGEAVVHSHGICEPCTRRHHPELAPVGRVPSPRRPRITPIPPIIPITPNQKPK